MYIVALVRINVGEVERAQILLISNHGVKAFEARSNACLNLISDAGFLPEWSSNIDPLIRNIAADKLAILGKAKRHAQGRVASENAYLDSAFSSGHLHEHFHEFTLVWCR